MPSEGLRDWLKANLKQSVRDGLTFDDVVAAAREVYGIRVVNGYEVHQGWEMPEPPIPGAYLCVEFHGGDGNHFYWWHDDWPGGGSAWGMEKKVKELGLNPHDFELDDVDPLVAPDTGGADVKGCQEAYAELGIRMF
jgi:hypothetical protein